jgi:hypothetical protein
MRLAAAGLAVLPQNRYQIYKLEYLLAGNIIMEDA